MIKMKSAKTDNKTMKVTTVEQIDNIVAKLTRCGERDKNKAHNNTKYNALHTHTAHHVIVCDCKVAQNVFPEWKNFTRRTKNHLPLPFFVTLCLFIDCTLWCDVCTKREIVHSRSRARFVDISRFMFWQILMTKQLKIKAATCTPLFRITL